MTESVGQRSRADAARLFLCGFLVLFLELVLIRYLAGNIWNLGYFPNLVLLSVFVGMGVGFLLHHTIPERISPAVFQAAAFVLLLLVVLVKYVSPSVPGFDQLFGHVGGEVYFTATPKKSGASTSFFLFGVWFLSIVAIFAFISQWTAKLFKKFKPLTAYTLDISGSCVGIVSFMLVSWLHVPAYLWFVFVLPLFVGAMNTSLKWRFLPVVPFALVMFLSHSQDAKLASNPNYDPAKVPGGKFEVIWSPYQKVEYIRDDRNQPAARGIYVNGISHQVIFSEAGIRSPRYYYRQPHDYRKRQKRPPYEDVMIIGAGSGNDVSAAVMFGAKHIDAVEIDPVLAELGKKYNPFHPYDKPQVHLIINDGRAFMTQTRRKYDLVIFALTDSLVKVSSMAQLRLENYLFTMESFRRAYHLLKPGGDLVIYNYYRANWLIEKYQRTLHAATGKYPKIVYKRTGNFVMMAVNKTDPGAQTPSLPGVAKEIATDDWPFPYLREKGMPGLYLTALALVFLLVVGMAIAMHFWVGHSEEEGGPSANLAVKLAFVFMGIAFLLLETKSIVQFSLLFGTTWVNTSLVFLAVLLLVLAANWTALVIHSKRALPFVYGLLLLSCLSGYFYPLRNLLELDSGFARFVFASLLTFSPIFFANLIFSISFRNQNVPEHVFGWNLLGATVGGLVEYTSMAIGYNALALIVAACYTVVFALLLYYNRTHAQPVG